MPFDEQALEFSLWRSFAEKYIAPYSLFDFRDSLGGFVACAEDFHDRHEKVRKLLRFISQFDEAKKPELQALKRNRIPNICFIDNADVLTGLSAVRIRKVSLFIRQAAIFFNLFSELEFMRFQIPEELISASSELLPFIDEHGNISDSHPEIVPLFKALSALFQGKKEYKKKFVSENFDNLEIKETAFRDGEEFFVFKNDGVLNIKGEEEIENGTKRRSNSGKSVYAQTKKLSDYARSENRIEARIEEAKRKIIARYSALYMKNKNVLSDALRKCMDSDFYFMLCEVVALYDLKETSVGDCIAIDGVFNPMIGSPVPFSFSTDLKRFVVTGSNGGGKTVFLRTISLLALQNQFITYVFAKQPCTLPLFSSIYTDVFDRQDVSEGLSGFTSRVKDLAAISLACDLGSSLLVIDEIERGTGDKDGFVLYEALRELAEASGLYMFVSTHSSRIKEHSLLDNGAEKLSFSYDSASARPDFKMVRGLCFETNARDILLNAGFCDSTSEKIRKFYDDLANEFDKNDLLKKTASLIEKEKAKHAYLDEKENELREKEKRLISKEEELNLMSVRLLEKERGLAVMLKEKRNPYWRTEKGGAREAESKKGVFKDTKEINEEISALKSRLNDIAMHKDVNYKVGDDIVVVRNGVRGRILEVDESARRVKAACGSFILTLNFYEVRKANAASSQKTEASFVHSNSSAKLLLDFRGMRREDAIGELERQIDSAILSSLPFFSVICGIGEGIIRQACIETLSKYSKFFNVELSQDGGKIDITRC